MDLNLLNVFDVVMTERHVTRSAERLNMTQSAVSNALNRLRIQFQDQLFVKIARGVDATPRALALWPRIHQALEDLRATVHPQDFDPSQQNQLFRIAMADITASLLTPHLYRNVQSLAPKTRFFFVPYDSALAGPRLMRGELDFVVGIEPPRATVIQTMPLWSDSFVIAARRGHPIFEEKISLATFCDAPQVVVNEAGDEQVSDLIDNALADRGLTRNIALSVNQFAVVPTILLTSELITVLPLRFATALSMEERITFRALPFSLTDVVIYMSWHQRSNNVPAHQWLKQRLLEAATALNLETDSAQKAQKK